MIISISGVKKELHDDLLKWIHTKSTLASKAGIVTFKLSNFMITKYKSKDEFSVSVHIRIEIRNYLNYLTCAFGEPIILFATRSEFIRSALLYAELREHNVVHENIFEPPKTYVVRRLDPFKMKPKVYPKPNSQLNIYKYDINCNLLISFLNEMNEKLITMSELIELTKIDRGSIQLSFRKLNADYPLLIRKYKNGRDSAYYNINKDKLHEILETL